MDESLLAAEFLIRARRTLKEAKIAFDDGDLYYTLIRVLDTVENLSKVLLTLNGKYALDTLWNAISLSGNSDLENKLRDLEVKLMPLIYLNESPLKSPSVFVRNKEAEILLDEINKVFEEVEKIYDEYHS